MSKVEWGNATWYLIHTLCNKLVPSNEIIIRQLFNHLTTITTNLPCPDCSHHSSLFINHYKNNIPKTNDQLNIYFWNMHNWVNKRLRKSEFSVIDYKAKYDLANTNNIINYYISVINKNANNSKAM